MFYPIQPAFQITDFFYTIFDRFFSEDFKFDGGKHNFWEVVYVLDGKIEVAEDEKVYILGEKDIIFHAPNEFHCIRSAENTCPHVLNISFRTSGNLPELFKHGVMHLSSSLHEEYIGIVSMLQAWEFERNNNNENPDILFEISCRLSAFFMRLIRNSNSKESLSTSASARTYSMIVEMMHKEVYRNLSLRDFAEKSYVSISYIKKLFSYYAGISPKNYYVSLRLSEAEKLLLSGASVSDIAEKMNFSSASYFTLFFKNQTGCTPVQYRKMHAKI